MNKGLTAVISIAVLIILAAIIVTGADKQSALMYANDSPWPYEEQYPQADIFHVEYLPSSMFSSLENCTVRENNYLRNVVISRGEKYVTFDLNNSIIYTSDGKQFSGATYLLYGSERYVPAELTCESLGLKYEKIGDAVRISDDSAKKSFNELLLEYNSALAVTEPVTETEPATETDPPIETQPPIETAPPPIETIPIETEPEPERDVYLTFVCGGGSEIEISAILKKADMNAAFFCYGDFIAENRDTVRAFVGDGHTVGLYGEADDDIKEKLSAANNSLYIITKFKTRLFSCSKDDCERLQSVGGLASLNADGYSLCDFNCDVYYNLPATKSFLVSSVKKHIDANTTSVLRFNTDEYLLNALPDIVALLDGYSNLKVKLISEALRPKT